MFYIAGCIFVAIQNMEDWEEALFDKKSGKAILKTFNLYKKLLTLCRGGQEQVVVKLNEIRDVNVEEEKVRYFGKGYVIVLRFLTGISHPLTQSAVLGSRGDVEAVAKLLTNFLELDMAVLKTLAEQESSDSEVEDLAKEE
ncbi:cytochrome b-245 chaperone 1 isoform X1 [Pelobates cultripes]|nr:cytochrome b-245 chaperone 1 isoform X1 [Pelobates cultripes]